MIAAALLLAASAPPHAADAERAFAAMAQRAGQWTAFRAFAAPEAIMMAPERVDAQAFLAPLADPPRAVMWWPARAIPSCDGTLAISTGPWIRDGGRSAGTFTTVWKRQPDGGWKWLFDHGRDTPRATAAADTIAVRRPDCRRRHARTQAPPPLPGPTRLGALLARAPGALVQVDGRMPTAAPDFDVAIDPAARIAAGASDDGSLLWALDALAGEKGAHLFRAWQAGRLVLIEIAGVPAS